MLLAPAPAREREREPGQPSNWDDSLADCLTPKKPDKNSRRYMMRSSDEDSTKEAVNWRCALRFNDYITGVACRRGSLPGGGGRSPRSLYFNHHLDLGAVMCWCGCRCDVPASFLLGILGRGACRRCIAIFQGSNNTRKIVLKYTNLLSVLGDICGMHEEVAVLYQ